MSQNAPYQIDLDEIIKSKSERLYRRIPRFALNYLKRKVHIDEINLILRTNYPLQGVDFMEGTLNYFKVQVNIANLEQIDRNGRYVFACNHPLGGFDGICLSTLIGRYFNDKIKYIVNDILYYLQPLKPIFVPVNKIGAQSKEAAAAQNEAFASDNQIITFPAGLCSRRRKGIISDLEWKKTFIGKAVESRRDIVPVYFDGQNSNFFYRFAAWRKALGIKFNVEMLLLPDEMFKSRSKTFNITVGKPIPFSCFDNTQSPRNWAQHVREQCYLLKHDKQ